MYLCVYNHFAIQLIDETLIGSWTSCTTLIRIHPTMEHATIKFEMYNINY